MTHDKTSFKCGFANPPSATDQPYRLGDVGLSFAPRDFRAQVALSLWLRRVLFIGARLERLKHGFLTQFISAGGGKALALNPVVSYDNLKLHFQI